MNAVHIMSAYTRYADYVSALTARTDETPVYIGDIFLGSVDTQADGSAMCLLWKNDHGIEYVRILVHDGRCEVSDIETADISPDADDLIWRSLYQEDMKKWLNLCHFRSVDGVRYDPYYDSLPCYDAEGSPSLKDLRMNLTQWLVDKVDLKGVDVLYLCGDASEDNVLQDVISSLYRVSIDVIGNKGVEDMPARPEATSGRMLLEAGCSEPVFEYFSAEEITKGHNPDIRFDGILAYVVDVVKNDDMAGNRFLHVKYMDGTERYFVNVNEKFA